MRTHTHDTECFARHGTVRNDRQTHRLHVCKAISVTMQSKTTGHLREEGRVTRKKEKKGQ